MSSAVSQEDWRALDALIPPDPNLPSLAYQARENVPIVLPWTRDNISLGIGLNSPAPAQTSIARDALRPSPFNATAGDIASVFEVTDNTNSFRQSSSAHAATSYEHMDLKGSLSVGGSFLGASGRGEFNKNVYDNRDSSKVSLQASLRVGRITYATIPRLSSRALSLLRTSPAAFHAAYGDYFLYSVIIGADTSTFLSTSSSVDLKSEMRDIQVKAKVLWVSKTVYKEHKSTLSTTSAYDITYTGFDSLNSYSRAMHATDEASYNALRAEAMRNVAAGITLEKRVEDKLHACGVAPGASLSAQEYAKVCESGLAVEGMFVPYASLRDYVACAATAARSLADAHVERVL